MMERHIVRPEHWKLWLDLLEARPDRAAELDARASLLHERAGAPPDGIVRAMLAAAQAEDALDRTPPVADRAGVGRWGWLALVLAFGAGWIGARGLTPEPEESLPIAWRGEAPGSAGTLRVEQGGASLAQAVVGRGVRPRVELGQGPLVLRWQAPSDLRGQVAVAWWASDGAVLGEPWSIQEAQQLDVPGEAGTLVVAVLPEDADAAAIAARVTDARRSVEPLGEVWITAFDLVRAP